MVPAAQIHAGGSLSWPHTRSARVGYRELVETPPKSRLAPGTSCSLRFELVSTDAHFSRLVGSHGPFGKSVQAPLISARNISKARRSLRNFVSFTITPFELSVHSFPVSQFSALPGSVHCNTALFNPPPALRSHLEARRPPHSFKPASLLSNIAPTQLSCH